MCACVHVFLHGFMCMRVHVWWEDPCRSAWWRGRKKRGAMKKQRQTVAWRTLSAQLWLGICPRTFNWSSASCPHSVIISRRSRGHFYSMCTKTQIQAHGRPSDMGQQCDGKAQKLIYNYIPIQIQERDYLLFCRVCVWLLWVLSMSVFPYSSCQCKDKRMMQTCNAALLNVISHWCPLQCLLFTLPHQSCIKLLIL